MYKIIDSVKTVKRKCFCFLKSRTSDHHKVSKKMTFRIYNKSIRFVVVKGICC